MVIIHDKVGKIARESRVCTGSIRTLAWIRGDDIMEVGKAVACHFLPSRLYP